MSFIWPQDETAVSYKGGEKRIFQTTLEIIIVNMQVRKLDRKTCYDATYEIYFNLCGLLFYK